MILSPLEIEWKKLHSKTFPIKIFELETISIFYPHWEFDRNFRPKRGKKFRQGTETQGCIVGPGAYTHQCRRVELY